MQGLDSGFQGGEDDMYTVYDKPWRTGGGAADKIYRPSKNLDKDIYGDDVEKLIKTNKYVLWGFHTCVVAYSVGNGGFYKTLYMYQLFCTCH